ACRGGGVSPARREDRMGGWPRALVGVLIGATLGAGSARAASLRASFDPSPDSSADTYLVFSCQGDSTVCTQGSYVSTPASWPLVDSQPAAVVCASTPCAQTFSVVAPPAGQTQTLTVTMVAESPGPLLSGPSNVISVTLTGGTSTTSTTTIPKLATPVLMTAAFRSQANGIAIYDITYKQPADCPKVSHWETWAAQNPPGNISAAVQTDVLYPAGGCNATNIPDYTGVPTGPQR